jgi:hypothetical protein
MLTGSAFEGDALGEASLAAADVVAAGDGSPEAAWLAELFLLPHPARTIINTRVLISMIFFIFMFIPSHLIAIFVQFYCRTPIGSVSRCDLWKRKG